MYYFQRMGTPNNVMLTFEFACGIVEQLSKNADEMGLPLQEYIKHTMQITAQSDLKRALLRKEKLKQPNADETEP